MNEDAGRARVFNWTATTRGHRKAIDMRPVNCISFVDHEDLVILETEREGITINPDVDAHPGDVVGAPHSVPPTKASWATAAGRCCNNCPGRGCKECPMHGTGSTRSTSSAWRSGRRKRRRGARRRASARTSAGRARRQALWRRRGRGGGGAGELEGVVVPSGEGDAAGGSPKAGDGDVPTRRRATPLTRCMAARPLASRTPTLATSLCPARWARRRWSVPRARSSRRRAAGGARTAGGGGARGGGGRKRRGGR